MAFPCSRPAIIFFFFHCTVEIEIERNEYWPETFISLKHLIWSICASFRFIFVLRSGKSINQTQRCLFHLHTDDLIASQLKLRMERSFACDKNLNCVKTWTHGATLRAIFSGFSLLNKTYKLAYYCHDKVTRVSKSALKMRARLHGTRVTCRVELKMS